ncbi:ABC-type multidrug transport system, ATPase and permease component [Streptosporangium subroseum]|uniref:ABC-type multidrug transport system, ATPase and permease component n=1 Tax=Streptosporangium subroseum TaxID=106412 RepID=A0A239L6F9_9ACTN|nr:ABC transporter ATP-binding protein [Streptosporangium subroseum]SNT25104.1 ABC-type multidrug transport system, ATPase and permease component [Streptosporangium subroseum]
MKSVSNATPGREFPPGDLKIMRELVSGRYGQVLAIGVLALLSAAATLSLPLVVAALVGTVQANKGLTWPALTMVGVGLGAALAGTLAAYLLSRLGERLICRLRIQTMRKSLDLRLSDARREGSGNLATRLTSDAMQLKGAIDIGPIQLPMALITLVGTLIIMGFLDWVLLLITMGGFTVAVGIIIAVIMGLRRKYGAMQENLGELTQQFITALDALTIIKAYRAEDRVTRTLADRAEHLSKLGVQVARMESLMIPVINLGQQVALLTVLVGGGARLLSGELTLAEFVAFLLYLLQLTAPLILAASGASNVQAGLMARQRFSQLFTLPAENEDLETGTVAEAVGESVHPGTPAIQFEQVTFAYGDQPVLHGVDFTVPSSGLTAMVGLSGAGKSTILGLVEHFVTPESGQVRVFGQDMTRIPTDTLRSQIAYVDQSFTLLRDTIRANLSLGHSDLLPDEVLLPALAKVGLEEEILRLPDGLDTVLGGENDLSGGQRQRVALARAALTDARLVLLDEPSSQLDSVNEGKLREVVDELARDRAVLVVAHRISTVQHADQVIVLDRGRVVAEGTHAELLGNSPEYIELVSGQLLRAPEAMLAGANGAGA